MSSIVKAGMPAYNAACKSIVLRYSDQWKNIIGRLGRWIDWNQILKLLIWNI